MPTIVPRPYSTETAAALLSAGLHPVLARIYAARGVTDAAQLQAQLSRLIAPEQLLNVGVMANYLADAIIQRKRLLIVADYDADGATACAVGVAALRKFGAIVDYLVPNRFEHGYGLTPEIVRLAAERQPDFIITVDNGIASMAGVAEANKLGIAVLVTDHHLPGDALPDAACIVNPNAGGCTFPSKNLAGVGVIFYVMLALRSELRQRGMFESGPGAKTEPNLAELLDIVALGTVADVVRLDENNRILVEQGLHRIRAGKACPGINALLRVAARDPKTVTTHDLGFMLGPRLNAAGRMQDMSLGIECLLATDPQVAQGIAAKLDEMNRSRREVEAEMQQEALSALEQIAVQDCYSYCLYDPGWHQGIIGILASRIKEKYHRPVIAFAAAGDGMVKGSGRSIAGLHLRDALDIISKREPDLIIQFGGHAMAAGLTIAENNVARFTEVFEQLMRDLLTPAELDRLIETDGELDAGSIALPLARLLEQGIWGQGFATPLFQGQFNVIAQRVVGEKHLKLKLGSGSHAVEAMQFFDTEAIPEVIEAVYQLGVNEFNGQQTAQLILRHWQAA
jgi:single-stranded-DNA-specific exonuclease